MLDDLFELNRFLERGVRKTEQLMQALISQTSDLAAIQQFVAGLNQLEDQILESSDPNLGVTHHVLNRAKLTGLALDRLLPNDSDQVRAWIATHYDLTDDEGWLDLAEAPRPVQESVIITTLKTLPDKREIWELLNLFADHLRPDPDEWSSVYFKAYHHLLEGANFSDLFKLVDKGWYCPDQSFSVVDEAARRLLNLVPDKETLITIVIRSSDEPARQAWNRLKERELDPNLPNYERLTKADYDRVMQHADNYTITDEAARRLCELV